MIRELLTKTKLANIAAFICVVVSLGYFIAMKDPKGVMFLAGAGVGYLFKRTESGAE